MTATPRSDDTAPAGVLTFLFTDIEGSTQKWEREPERMAQAVACHDQLMRMAVEGHGGRVVKTTGDGIHAVFADALDGIRAVIDIQAALVDPSATAGVPLAVRCGLHTGAAEVRANDYFGRTLNRAARIMGAAYGGQALVSHSVAEQVADRLPAETRLRELGGLRLKGLSAAERVYQVIHPRLRAEFPPLRSLEATPNNLPHQLTSFIGREREVAQAKVLVSDTRLLTLAGMGGMGKTRLALQIGSDSMDRFEDGVWFVDLAPLLDPSLVGSEVAKVLGVREEPGRPLIPTLCAHLRTRSLLLILDNCEQVIGAAAVLVRDILAAAPEVRIIATSREVLRVPGEQTLAVQPLSLPKVGDGVDALAQSTAVQLFVERARAHKPGFTLTDRDAQAVAELVAGLEGIPLAIELAAARLRALPVSEIGARLKERYKLLTAGSRVLQKRQQTLRALVDWSYNLLREDEKTLLGRLGVFAGGFDLAAAEEVCGSEPLTAADILDLLTSLVDKSLVVLDERADGARYRMLETIREYAREKLEARGELPEMAARHCDRFLAMAKTANREIQGKRQGEWTRRIERDLDNFRSAIVLALDGKVDPVLAVKFEVALQSFWLHCGYATEGRRYVQASLDSARVRASEIAYAHALYVAAALAGAQGDYRQASAMLETCRDLRRRVGPAYDLAGALSTLSNMRLHAGDPIQARRDEAEAHAIFREEGHRIGEMISILHLAEIARFEGDDDQATREIERALALARELGHREVEAEGERMLGEIALDAGDATTARERFARSLAICRDAGERGGEASTLWLMGKADLAEGDWRAAHERLGAALRAFRAYGMNAEVLGCIEDHAALARAYGLAELAVSLCAAADAHRERVALPRPPRRYQQWQNAMVATRALVDDGAFDAAWSQGRTWELDEAVGQALEFRARLPGVDRGRRVAAGGGSQDVPPHG